MKKEKTPYRQETCVGQAVSKIPKSNACTDLLGKPLTGWEEIRHALVFLESLPTEERNDVRVEDHEYSKESSVKMSFTSLQKLNELLEMRFRRQLLKGDNGSTSRKLDVLSEVHGHVVIA